MSTAVNYIVPYIAFVIFANPVVFKIVRSVLGSWVSTADGLATPLGLAFHGLVYIAIVGFIMTQTQKKNIH